MHLSQAIRNTLDSGGGQAFEVEGVWRSWNEVREVADAVQARLEQLCIPARMPVALIGKNRFTNASAFLGILCAERCVVPINPFQPADRVLADILSVGVAAVIGDIEDFASIDILPALAQAGIGVVCLGGSAFLAETLLPANGLAGVTSSGDVGLLIPTSGTTGAPKRIPLRFDTLASANRDAEVAAFGFGEREVAPASRSALIQYSPLVHITGALTVSRAGSIGRRVILLEKFAVEPWVSAVERNRIEVAGLPPTMMQMVLTADPSPARLASLRSVWSGSSPVDQSTVAEFERRYGVSVLGNYGATEYCGVVACGSLADRHTFGAAKEGSVGRLRREIADARICDPETFALLPVGEVGILELKVHRVGPDWMRTSDLARIDEDGFLYIHGRADDAIIRGGFKIVPSVISDVIKRFPGVTAVAVAALPDRRLGSVPVAAVELAEGDPDKLAEAIHRFARDNLVAYQVPVAVKVVRALPRTPSLKVDKRAVLALF
jgi:acyl-CoA synthetase (AMP-forming)/AMP-acid ligase II